jgi:hypothetical protein
VVDLGRLLQTAWKLELASMIVTIEDFSPDPAPMARIVERSVLPAAHTGQRYAAGGNGSRNPAPYIWLARDDCPQIATLEKIGHLVGIFCPRSFWSGEVTANSTPED